jgi:hypothetical protein
MVHSAVVGSTHHAARAGAGGALPGPQPTFFFAPDRLAERRRAWGASVLGERIGEAMTGFIDGSPWLRIHRHHGRDGLAGTYQAILAGDASPDEGDIISLTISGQS